MLDTVKKPFFVAEISANHCGNFSLAKKLIKCAKDNNADAVKLQTYTADTMTINSKKTMFKIKDGLWKDYSLWDLYNEAHTPISWHKELFDYAKKIGITIFSSPFDETAVDLLENIGCPIYKIASFEMTDIPLIKKIAQTRKPIIMSTGMANLKEIEYSFYSAKKNGAKDITILYCVSKYPCKNTDFNLNNIKILKDRFKCRVGLSDHSKDINITRAAIAAGAEVLEKHIALKNQRMGLDIEFSLKGDEIKKFKTAADETYSMLGKNYFFRSSSENKNKKYRRSIFAVENIKKGDLFTKKNIRRIRPSNGVEPKYYELILNKKSPSNIKEAQPIKMSHLKKMKIK
jgi:pseudaminic acid synthase